MKYLPLSMLFITIYGNLFSQITIGTKLGINYNSVIYENSFESDMMKDIKQIKPGLVTGFLFNIQLNKILAVQSEILYSQKGLKYKQAQSEGKNTMNYIEIPISGQFNIIPKNRMQDIYIYIGGYGAFWTDGRLKKLDYSTGQKINYPVDFKSGYHKYNRIDAGLISGIYWKRNKLMVDLRYTHSMLSSSEKTATAVFNRLISFSITYLFYKHK